MDFKVAPEIVKSMKNRFDHNIYGYSVFSKNYYRSVINWMKKRHDWEVDREWIVYTPGIVTALSLAIKAFSKAGDEIIIQPPVYHRFYDVIKNNDRRVVENPLIEKNGKYFMDLEDLEQKVSKGTKVMVLCSPHNPVGRVWSEGELRKLSEICLKYGITIISDEIHFDIVYKGSEHTVLPKISSEIAENSVICTSPTKTFNLAGVHISNIIIPNENLRARYKLELQKDHLIRPNILSEPALVGAYDNSEDWLNSLLIYLEENRNYVLNFIESRIPKLRAISPEGTYLVWIDCEEISKDSEIIRKFFLEECGLVLSQGVEFGSESKSFQRLNIACSRLLLKEALERIERALK